MQQAFVEIYQSGGIELASDGAFRRFLNCQRKVNQLVGRTACYTVFDATAVNLERLHFRRVRGADVANLRPVAKCDRQPLPESAYWLLSDGDPDDNEHVVALFPAFTCSHGALTSSTTTIGIATVFEDQAMSTLATCNAANTLRKLLGLSHLLPTHQWQHRLSIGEHVAVRLGARPHVHSIKRLPVTPRGVRQLPGAAELVKISLPASGRYLTLHAGDRLALHGKEWVQCMATLAEESTSTNATSTLHMGEERVHLWRHQQLCSAVSVVRDPAASCNAINEGGACDDAIGYLRYRLRVLGTPESAASDDDLLLAALDDVSIPPDAIVDGGLALSLRARLGLLSEIMRNPHVLVVPIDALELLMDCTHSEQQTTVDAVQQWLVTFPNCVVVTYDDAFSMPSWMLNGNSNGSEQQEYPFATSALSGVEWTAEVNWSEFCGDEDDFDDDE